MIDQPLIQISSEQLAAGIHPAGAQLFFLRDPTGRDLQWNGDPAIWKGRAPILFPIVGALVGNQYRLSDRAYSLSRHGFARDRLFSIVKADPASVVLRLDWDEETHRVYPFRFQLDLRFTIAGACLHIVATLRNLEDKETMPASFGFHPAFRWPLAFGEPRAAHYLTFDKDEPAPIRRLDSEGLLTPKEFATPIQNRKLHLSDALFAADAMIFNNLVSRRLTYGTDQGPKIEIAFPDMPYLGVWTKPGAGFICIEPWHGIADPQGYSGDFRTKPGIVLLPPGAAKDFVMSITLKT